MKIFTKNLQLKILAFMAAAALWFFVVGIENTVYRFPHDFDVIAMNVSPDLSLSSSLGKAKVRLKTTPEDYKNLTPGDFEISVDLKNYFAGEYNVPLSAKVKNDKVTLLRIEPAEIHLVLEPIVTKELKVNVFFSGNPQHGYAVKDIKLDQTSAIISGAKSLIDQISVINAEVKLDSTQSTSFKTNVKLSTLANDDFKNVTIKPEQVAADITVEPELQQKTIVIKPDIKGGVDFGTEASKIEINPLTVVIQGKEAILNAINFLTTEPVTMDQLRAQNTVKVKLLLPKDVALLEGQPNRVDVSLKTVTSLEPKSKIIVP